MTAKQLTSSLCSLLLLAPAMAAQPRQEGAGFGNWWRGVSEPYSWKEVAPVNLANSARLDQLLRAGKLYLSLQDTIALALENNLDIELQRYGPMISNSELLRAQAGGTVTTGGTNTVSNTTISSSGGGGVGNGSLGGSSTTTTAAQTGQNANSLGSLDPVFTGTMSWAHQTTPQTNTFTTGTNSLVNERTLNNFGIQKSFLTGTSVSMGFNNSFLSQNSPRNLFNPSKNVSLNLQVSQSLLQGFGMAVNSRNIRIAKNNLKVSELVFKQQVITTVANIISIYWNLVSANEDLQVKKQALALNQKLYEDNKKQVEIGTLAPIEIIRAEAEVARSQQDLTISETNVLQQETSLKNALSRSGVGSPGLAEARIVPTDKIRIPENEPIQPVQDLVSLAFENRPELEQSRINIESSKIGLKGSRNALLPTVNAFVSLQNNGQSGAFNPLYEPTSADQNLLPGTTPGDPFFLGGYGTAFSQLLRRNFPDYSAGVTLNIPLRNRTAQANMVRDQLSLRQSEIRLQQSINQVRVEVQNALISLQQARAQYQSAVKNRILQEQTLDAEQKKYALGASSIFLVIQAQRDLTAAQAAEVTALSTYARGRTELERSTGQTLIGNNVQIDEAVKGTVKAPPSTVPGVQ